MTIQEPQWVFIETDSSNFFAELLQVSRGKDGLRGYFRMYGEEGERVAPMLDKYLRSGEPLLVDGVLSYVESLGIGDALEFQLVGPQPAYAVGHDPWERYAI